MQDSNQQASGQNSTNSASTGFLAAILAKKNLVKSNMEQVKHKIGVYSAKGGVGKTTVAINLAYALKELGYKVGLLDADIDTPNVALFLGINERQQGAYPLQPVEKYGMKIISTTFYTDDTRKPIVWRGPLIAKMVEDFIINTEWGALDYLLIDLPPGTSDAPLSIMQLLDMDGFLVVTTPQHTSALNAIRSGLMARRLSVAVLGVIENMSSGAPVGANEVAAALNVKVLGAIKQNRKFDEFSDTGKIPAAEDKEIREEFISIASKLVE
ncbi:MAG: P-loop NTPase [Candidatus Micrarchaeaceae archaeon]